MKQLLTFALAATLLAPAFGLEWMENFDAALAKAKAENKLVLADFTGSDWCGWCIKLRKEVLDKPEFEAYAKDKFVFMEVDCPRKKKQDAALTQQNQKLCQHYHINGFPTILALNAEGEVVGGFGGYQKMEGVQETLDKAIKASEAIAQAKQLPEAEKEAALNAVYTRMEKSVRQAGGYTVTGEAEAAQQRKEINAKLNAASDTDEMKKIIAEAESGILPANKTFFLDRKFLVMVNAADSLEELAEARKVGDELIQSLPAPYNAHIKAQIERDFADPEALLQKLRDGRVQK